MKGLFYLKVKGERDNMNPEYYNYEKLSETETKENEIVAQLRQADALEILLDNNYNDRLFEELIKNFGELGKEEKEEFLNELSGDVEKINTAHRKFLMKIEQ